MWKHDLPVINWIIRGSKPPSNISGLQMGEFLPVLLWHRPAWGSSYLCLWGPRLTGFPSLLSPVSIMAKSGKETCKRKQASLSCIPDLTGFANFALADFSYMQSLGLVAREQTTCGPGEKISTHELPLSQSFLWLQRYRCQSCILTNYHLHPQVLPYPYTEFKCF